MTVAQLLTDTTALMHSVARERFKVNPSKCYQRHIRELYAVREGRAKLESLKGAVVEQVSFPEAKQLITKYEWLGNIPDGCTAYYGLKLNGELLGVVCFAIGGSAEARAVFGDAKAVCLSRGACVPHAPRNAATFLISHACKQAQQQFGWDIFFAYSDAEAGELGTIYRAANWACIGKGKGGNSTFVAPDGSQKITSYGFTKRLEKKFYALGWDGKQGKYEFLRSLGWVEQKEPPKTKWAWSPNKRINRAIRNGKLVSAKAAVAGEGL